MNDACHISSLIVRVLPGRFGPAIAAIAALPGVEIGRHDDTAKAVVVLETRTQGEIAERIRAMEALPGVLNVSLIFHHADHPAGQDPIIPRGPDV